MLTRAQAEPGEEEVRAASESDVFVPDLWMAADEELQQFSALGAGDDLDDDAIGNQPLDRPAKGLVFADDDPWNAELHDRAGAQRTGRQG
jgi:hypothetical protein